MSVQLNTTIFNFLEELNANNTKEWMQANKKTYKANELILKTFYNAIKDGLNATDVIDTIKVFRINRDIRFSKDKTPYNTHRSVSFSRSGEARRGGYYLRIEARKATLAGGFFGPEPADLMRIRKEFEMDSTEIRAILNAPKFKSTFGGFNQEYTVKTAPKGFSKDHPDIDLIKLKSFFVTCTFNEADVLAPNFVEKVVSHFELLRPFFDYMSHVLTTDLNGVSLIKD